MPEPAHGHGPPGRQPGLERVNRDGRYHGRHPVRRDERGSSQHPRDFNSVPDLGDISSAGAFNATNTGVITGNISRRVRRP